MNVSTCLGVHLIFYLKLDLLFGTDDDNAARRTIDWGELYQS